MTANGTDMFGTRTRVIVIVIVIMEQPHLERSRQDRDKWNKEIRYSAISSGQEERIAG